MEISTGDVDYLLAQKFVDLVNAVAFMSGFFMEFASPGKQNSLLG